MASRWTSKEEKGLRDKLRLLYVTQNKTIGEIGKILNVHYTTVFGRLKRLGIKSQPHLKSSWVRKPKAVRIPKRYSVELAEFFGIMLGDGHVSHFQVVVTLGTKELKYAEYVQLLLSKIFKTNARIATRSDGYRDVYFGSTIVTDWLLKEGLVFNKVASQVDIPKWIFSKKKYMISFLTVNVNSLSFSLAFIST